MTEGQLRVAEANAVAQAMIDEQAIVGEGMMHQLRNNVIVGNLSATEEMTFRLYRGKMPLNAQVIKTGDCYECPDVMVIENRSGVDIGIVVTDWRDGLVKIYDETLNEKFLQPTDIESAAIMLSTPLNPDSWGGEVKGKDRNPRMVHLQGYCAETDLTREIWVNPEHVKCVQYCGEHSQFTLDGSHFVIVKMSPQRLINKLQGIMSNEDFVKKGSA